MKNQEEVMLWTEEIEKGFKEYTLPDYMKEGVLHWVIDGIPPGSFLTAVLQNNLRYAVLKADEVLTNEGFKVTQLPVSAAFHTPLVEHASKPFAKAVKNEEFLKTTIPVYSNTTGKAYPADKNKSREILGSHILHPVIFKTQIEEIYKKGGRVFVEIGPRQILGNLVKDILEGKSHSVVSVNPSREKSSDRQLREAVVTLKVIGLPILNIDPYQAASGPVKSTSVQTRGK
jgi:acyl transferase domain-containing protein